MIVDAYQQILRNCEIKADASRKIVKVQPENAGASWFAQYGPALAGLWTAKAAKA